MDQCTKKNSRNKLLDNQTVGTIYGENTVGSMKTILTDPVILSNIRSDVNCKILDVGLGSGCVVFQSAQLFGFGGLLFNHVECAGIELIENRLGNSLINHNSLVQKSILSVNCKIAFACCDACNLESLDPFTIVYFFHKGLTDVQFGKFLEVLNNRYVCLCYYDII